MLFTEKHIQKRYVRKTYLQITGIITWRTFPFLVCFFRKTYGRETCAKNTPFCLWNLANFLFRYFFFGKHMVGKHMRMQKYIIFIFENLTCFLFRYVFLRKHIQNTDTWKCHMMNEQNILISWFKHTERIIAKLTCRKHNLFNICTHACRIKTYELHQTLRVTYGTT